MVTILIVAFIVLSLAAILFWRAGDSLLAKFRPARSNWDVDMEDEDEGPPPFLIFPVDGQQSNVTPLPIGSPENALSGQSMPAPAWHGAANGARSDDLAREGWFPPQQVGASRSETLDTPPGMPLGDTPAGVTVAFERPVEEPVQILPGQPEALAGEPRLPAVPVELAGGKYEVIRELGRGGMAVVYLARERTTGHEWAVKVIHGQFGNNADALGRFEREAELVARLQHQGIVSIHAVERLENGGLALVMDYIPGRTIKQLVHDEGPLSFERVQQWLDDIADALGYAHAQGVVHRDVKPENIFVNEKTGRAVLADFGIARSLQGDSQLTLTSVAIGTPVYMAPEQLDAKKIDARSDLYSLGVVGWEMLTGRRPWDGESLYQVIYRVKTDELPPIDTVRPDTPERLLVAIEGLLAKSVSDRWQNATQFRTQLTTGSALRQQRTPSAVPASIISTETIAFTRPRVKRTRRWVVPAVGAASLLLIGTTLVFARPGSGRWLAQPAPAAVTQPHDVPMQRSVPLSNPVVPAAELPMQSAGGTLGDPAKVVRPDTEALPHFSNTPSVLSSPIHTYNAPTTVSPLMSSAPMTPVAPSAAPAPELHTVSAPARSGSNVAQRYTVAPGITNTCLASPAGDIQCWGGNGTRASVGGQLHFIKLSVGASSMCAIAATHEAYCWGSNESGQLGDGTGTAHTTPSAVVGDYKWTSIATGSAHACGVSTDARVFCWGNGRSGQLGNGAGSNASRPVAISGVKGIAFATVVTGWNHSCALTTDGVAYCWGDNGNGALGDGTTSERSTPVAVHTTAHFIMLAAGSAHTCGITTSNAVLCWGQNKYGQLGIAPTDGKNSSQLTPTPIRSSETFVTMTAGGVHTCAISRDNDAWCWGRNGYGQLGDGSTIDRSVPTRVSGDHHFATVAAFGAHTCGTTVTDELFCWGYNLNGQIGDGTREHRLRPTYVEK